MNIVHLILFYWETLGLGFHVDVTLTLSSIYCKYSCRPRTAPLLLWSDMWFNPFSRLSPAVYPLLISLRLANNVNTLILFPVIRFKSESQSFKLKRLWIFFCSCIKSNIFSKSFLYWPFQMRNNFWLTDSFGQHFPFLNVIAHYWFKLFLNFEIKED